MKKMAPALRDLSVTLTFKDNLHMYLNSKFWTSISALHWMATFLDPTFKQLEFIPQVAADDMRFNWNLVNDRDTWMMEEMNAVTDILNARNRETVEAG